MKSLIVTDSGNELIAKVIAGETTISFTRIAVSDRDYSEIDVKQIKDLQQIKQTVPISKISRIDKNMIEVLAAVENRQVEEPYFVYALGIYAKDSNENEILYGVSLCDENPDYMPAYEGKVLSGISYRLDIVVGDSEQVVLDVNPAAVATVLQVEQIENDLIRHTQDREIHVTEEKQKKWDAVEDKVDKLEAAEIKMLGWSVPRECVIQNEINGNKFIQKSGRIDLGDVEWSYYSERGHEGLRGENPGNLKAVSNNGYVANIYTSVYETSTADNAYNHTKDKIIGVNTSGYISVYDSSYTDVDAFKTAMQGQYLYYELATPITKTIDGNELSTTKADKTEVPKLVKVDNKTVFLSEDGVLSAKGGGGSSFAPKEVTNASITNGNGKVSIKWTDPSDVTLEGVTLSTWAGTKLVMNESNYPTNENDGTVVLNSTTRNQYQSTGYTVTGLTNNKTYYFALFPYSTDGMYNYSETGRLLGKPSLVKLDPCTGMKATATMGKVTISWTDPNATKTENGNTATWGKTVLVYKQGTTAPTNINDGTIAVEETTRNQYQSTGYTVTGLTNGNDYSFSLFAISTDGTSSDKVSVSAKLYATLTVTTEEASLYGKAVTVTSGSQKVTGTFSNSGSVTLRIPWMGNTTISATDSTDTTTATVNIAEYGRYYNAELSFLKIATFADGADEEIAAMIEAHYNNKINIADYWAVGDKRKVNLSAMSATGVDESHRAQAVEFAIADFDHDDLNKTINGHTKAAVTLTQVDCLMDAKCAAGTKYGMENTERGRLSDYSNNNGGWEGCSRRTWCNSVYYNALPSALKKIVKEVNKKTSAGNQSTTIKTTADKTFLLSEIELFGRTSRSATGEGNQYQYYKNTTANRYKLPKEGYAVDTCNWWQRSPDLNTAWGFCYMNTNGESDNGEGIHFCGIAPCFCL